MQYKYFEGDGGNGHYFNPIWPVMPGLPIGVVLMLNSAEKSCLLPSGPSSNSKANQEPYLMCKSRRKG